MADTPTSERTELLRDDEREIQQRCEKVALSSMFSFTTKQRIGQLVNEDVPELLTRLCEARSVSEREKQELKILRRIPKGEVWYWQGDGSDFPESLGCPVIMEPTVLRDLLAAKKDSERLEWVGANRAIVYKNQSDTKPWTCYIHPSKYKWAETMREAIDLAMAEAKEGR